MAWDQEAWERVSKETTAVAEIAQRLDALAFDADFTLPAKRRMVAYLVSYFDERLRAGDTTQEQRERDDEDPERKHTEAIVAGWRAREGG